MALKPTRAKPILKRFADQRILVVGDLMLDRYIYGHVSRISPEAPVPVVHVSHEKSMPGGASNVAANIRALGGASGVAGIMGLDAPAGELMGLLAKNGVGVGGVLELPDIKTTVKIRVIAERQQVVRIDWEDRVRYTAKTVDAFCAKLAREVAASTGVILEDYGKGVIEQRVIDTALAAAKKAGVPIGLDPKDNHVLRLDGITVATPNRKEAFVAARAEETEPLANPLEDRPLLEVGRILLDKWKPELLVITLGPHGMILFEGEKDPKHVPTRAREVFDVSGAGDTVIATCVLALAAGATHSEAAEIANYAAGVVVGKLGTAVCSQEELVQYMELA
ncbi:MAG TPA: PfkB family carbohydrate kinase [Kiritimatiellia bacterium]|jgi:D-beta-D-heptose 7-phosphate kinase/D-beta-D-heptose 1-phosphate adenosyltransferase